MMPAITAAVNNPAMLPAPVFTSSVGGVVVEGGVVGGVTSGGWLGVKVTCFWQAGPFEVTS